MSKQAISLPPDKPDDWLKGYIAGYVEGHKKALEYALEQLHRWKTDQTSPSRPA